MELLSVCCLELVPLHCVRTPSSLGLCLCAAAAQDPLLLEDVVSLGLSDGLIVDLSAAGA